MMMMVLMMTGWNLELENLEGAEQHVACQQHLSAVDTSRDRQGSATGNKQLEASSGSAPFKQIYVSGNVLNYFLTISRKSFHSPSPR